MYVCVCSQWYLWIGFKVRCTDFYYILSLLLPEYHQQSQEVLGSQVCSLRPAGSNPDDSPSQPLEKGAALVTQNEGADLEVIQEEIHGGLQQTSQASKESLCHFKYRLFSWLLESSTLPLLWRPMPSERSSFCLFGLEVNACLAACRLCVS